MRLGQIQTVFSLGAPCPPGASAFAMASADRRSLGGGWSLVSVQRRTCTTDCYYTESTVPPSALLVTALRKTYKDVVAVDGLELDVHAGECLGLLGPNGAGKTTTIEICEGLTEPDSGEVQVLGLRWAADAPALRQRLGIQLQETQLSDKLTVL